MRPGEFYINGESSIDMYNTIIQDRPLINAPVRKVVRGESSGRSGTLPMDTGEYKGSPLELILYSWSGANENPGFPQNAKYHEYRDHLYSIFNTGGYVELIFYFDPMKVYRVLLEENVQFENKYYYDDNMTWKVQLEVHPWKLSELNAEPKVFTRYGTIHNPTLHDSKPLIEITGKGKINLMINKKVFIMGEIPHHGIILDSEISTAYAYDGSRLVNMNSYTETREFPILRPGDNLIEWLVGQTGTVMNVKIRPRWVTLV